VVRLNSLSSGVSDYKILSLSGGGARGLFQAAFLALLERERGGPVGEHFDMIAGTSTGSLVGLALANGSSAETVLHKYKSSAVKVFRPRKAWWLRTGPRYKADALSVLVHELLGTTRMGDLTIDLVICASGLDRYRGRVFTTDDREVELAGVALASAAAPTYFPASTPRPLDASYVDGGLWANDPSHVAVLHAVNTLGVAPERIKLLSIGTGRVARGTHARAVDKMRVLSPDTLKFVMDISADLQAWHSERACAQLLGEQRVLRVNPELPSWIKLDDAKTSLDVLPGLASSTFDDTRADVRTWWDIPTADPSAPDDLPETLLQGLRAANVTRFMPSRKHYALYREGRESISSYVQLANHSLSMVSINLATGVDMEKIVDTFTAMICKRETPVRVRVSLLNPDKRYLLEAIAPVLGRTPEALGIRIADAINDLTAFAQDLPTWARPYFSLSCHNALPQASAIMIDENTTAGLIQLESKPYRSAFTSSFAWEAAYGSEYFQTLRSSYDQLIADGESRMGQPW
jgi:hypothetical protein